MYKRIISILLFVVSVATYAASPAVEKTFHDGLQYASKMKSKVYSQASHFNPAKVFDKYSSNPKQSNYYREGQAETAQMNGDAYHKMVNSSEGKEILKNINERPQYTIRLSDPDIALSHLVISQSDNIIHGVTSRYVDCQAHQQCHPEYFSKTCMASSIHQTMSCRKNLMVNAKQTQSSSVVEEHWSSGCMSLEQLTSQGICHQSGPEVCVSGKATHIINDIKVTRPCWSKKLDYQCQSNMAEDTCHTTPLEGCEQIGAECIQKTNKKCLVTRQAYRCQKTSCINTGSIVCGNGKDYCLDGSCTDHRYQPSKDFGRAIVELSATNDAVKDFDGSSIFEGKPMECRDDAANYSNCCAGKGWGQDTGLAHCDAEEKALGKNREKGLAIKVGRYCKKKIWRKCLEHKETFCVFGSKLAKVIQKQGRKGQLRIHFGDAKHADCRGIKPEELQRINFNRINFGDEYFKEVTGKMKSVNKDVIKKNIQRRIEQYQETGLPND